MIRRTLATMALAGALSPAAMAQVKLEYKPAEGTTLRHKTVAKVQQVLSIAGMDIATGSETDLVTTSANGKRKDDGTLPIEITIGTIRSKIKIQDQEFSVDSDDKDPKIDFPGLAFLGDVIKATRGASYTVVLDAKNNVKFVEGTEKNLAKVGDLAPQAAAELKSQFDADRIKREFEQEHGNLPDGLVREGEPWERTETKDISGGQSLTLKKRYEYKGTVTKDGKTLDKIDVKAIEVSYKMDPNAEGPAKVTKSDLKVASSDGTILFDREAGATVEHAEKYRLTGDMTLVIKINNEDKEFPSKLDLTLDSTTTSEKAPK
jgi:hypothetical protein